MPSSIPTSARSPFGIIDRGATPDPAVVTPDPAVVEQLAPTPATHTADLYVAGVLGEFGR